MKYRNIEDGVIQTTAKDYDINPEDVLRIYNNTEGDGNLFHVELEEFIKIRANQN